MLDAAALRAQRVRLLDAPGFVRWSEDETALWLSDAPRRLDEQALGPRLERLRALGDRLRISDGLLYIDLSDGAYRAMIRALPDDPPAFPRDAALLPAYALARLARAHPTDDADCSAARAMLKRWERPAEMARLAAALTEAFAVRLRRKERLPAGAARLMAAWLRQQEARQC